MLYRKESMILLFHDKKVAATFRFFVHLLSFQTRISGRLSEEKAITSSTTVNQDDDNFQITVSYFIFALISFFISCTFLKTHAYIFS